MLWSGYQRVSAGRSRIGAVPPSTAGRPTIDPDQAYNAGIIAGMSVQRGLKPRAASIALATAYQESGIPQPRLRAFRLAGPVPAAALERLGHRSGDHGPVVLDPRVLPGHGQSPEVGDQGPQRRGPGRPAQRLPGTPTASTSTMPRPLASALTGETPAAFHLRVRQPEGGRPVWGWPSTLTKTLEEPGEGDRGRRQQSGSPPRVEGQAWAGSGAGRGLLRDASGSVRCRWAPTAGRSPPRSRPPGRAPDR